MSEFKLCKDCKFESRDSWSYIPFLGADFRRFSMCGHPNFVSVNVVTGAADKQYYCSIVRSNDSCGKEAKYFEPK